MHESGLYIFSIVGKGFMELPQDVLWALDGPSHQLGVEHNVERVNAKMSLGFLVPPIHFNRIAHGLKRMKRQTDGQNTHVVFVGRNTAFTEYM